MLKVYSASENVIGKNAFFGHFEQLHERISGEDGSFKRVKDHVKIQLLADKNVPLEIGITRHNFFCVDEIVNFCLTLKGLEKDICLPLLRVFPPGGIMFNFIEYLNAIEEKIRDYYINLVIYDNKLFEILHTVQSCAQRDQIPERQLIRLLGIVCENAFIGPQTLVIDPFHRCNINCRHCFVHNPSIHHQPEFLNRKFDYDMFKGLIDDAAELLVDGIILQGDGEPLLYDRFFDMVRYARSQDINVAFFTNGILLDENKAREMVFLGVDEIYCSLPAGTAFTYELVTTTAAKEIFNTVICNLKKLMEIKRQAGRRYPRFIMTHVLHSLNYHEVIAMAETDVLISADAARFYLIRLDDNNKALRLKDEELKRIREDLPVAVDILRRNNIEFTGNVDFQLDNYDVSSGAWSKDVFLKEGCVIGWFFCLVTAHYDVSMCCHLRTVGQLTKQSFRELWNSREYRLYRLKAKFMSNNRDFVFPNGVKLYDEHCQQCDNHQALLANLDSLHKTGLYKFIK